MQRIIVDLPEPDGPQTTTRSFSATFSDTSRSTWSEPNHLFTLSITMIGGALVSARWATTWSAATGWLIAPLCCGTGSLALQRATAFQDSFAKQIGVQRWNSAVGSGRLQWLVSSS